MAVASQATRGRGLEGLLARLRGRRWTIHGYLFVLPFFVVFAVFQLYPILDSLRLSFSQWDGFGDPTFVGIQNYQRLLADSLFYRSIGNTLLIWLMSIAVQLPLALTLALILNERFIRGTHAFRAVFFFPNIVTPVSIGVLFSLLFDWQTGAVNKALQALHIVNHPIDWLGTALLSQVLVAAVMCWQWFGYNTLLYIAGLQSIPGEVVEAARVDGATGFQVATRITIPLLRPVVVFTLITSIIGGMQIFDVPFMLSGVGPDNSTLTIVMYLYNAAFKDSRYGYAATIAYATFVMIAVLSLITFRLTRARQE
jgi:ABC-type sugar transport system permease subunit